MTTVNFILTITLMSAATSAISLTITRSGLFAWLRDGLRMKHEKTPFRGSGMLVELFSCPYCVSHWVALALVWPYPIRLTEGYVAMDVIMLTFVVVAFSSIISGKVYGAIASIGDQNTPTEPIEDDR